MTLLNRRLVLCGLWCPTFLDVEGVGGEAEGGATVVAGEAAAVEELPLRAQALHHVHAPLAEVTHVTAADVLRELLPQGTLWRKEDWTTR